MGMQVNLTRRSFVKAGLGTGVGAFLAASTGGCAAKPPARLAIIHRWS